MYDDDNDDNHMNKLTIINTIFWLKNEWNNLSNKNGIIYKHAIY